MNECADAKEMAGGRAECNQGSASQETAGRHRTEESNAKNQSEK